MSHMGIDGPIRRTDRPKTKVIRPAGQLPVQPSHYPLDIQHSTAAVGLYGDILHHPFDTLLRWRCADIGPATVAFVASPEGVSKKIKPLLRYAAQVGLFFVHRQFQRLHYPAHRSHCFVSLTLAADNKIIRIIDDMCRQAAGISQSLPTQQEPPHVQIRQQRGDGRALWRAPSGILVDRCPFPATMAIIFFHRGIQPLSDEVQHIPVNYPTGDAFHQLRVWDAVEIARQIRIHYEAMTGVQ